MSSSSHPDIRLNIKKISKNMEQVKCLKDDEVNFFFRENI